MTDLHWLDGTGRSRRTQTGILEDQRMSVRVTAADGRFVPLAFCSLGREKLRRTGGGRGQPIALDVFQSLIRICATKRRAPTNVDVTRWTISTLTRAVNGKELCKTNLRRADFISRKINMCTGL
jgi:hypothetical protein